MKPLSIEVDHRMDIGKRLRQLRESKGLSQGAIEKRTGILRCNVSRYESGFMAPTLGTLEKWAEALRMPLWEILAGAEFPSEPTPGKPLTPYEKKLFASLKRLGEKDRALFISVANKMANQGGKNGR
jgi:transcriptional regulator with XRE-family HTH domain